jgi:hypothetical protein
MDKERALVVGTADELSAQAEGSKLRVFARG